jgi:MFS family permease
VKKDIDEYHSGDTGLEIGGGSRFNRLRNLRTFSSLKNSVYRLYLYAMLGQMAAMNMQRMARSLLIYRLTGSTAILGGMALADALPMLFLSLFGGVIADRVQKKYVLLFGQACSAAVSLGVAVSLTLGYLSPERAGSWWILIAASVLQGAITGLVMPSRQAIIREIVDEEELLNAVSLNNMGMNILRLLAPALTGFLIDAFDFEAVYYVMTGLYLMATIFITLLPATSTIGISGGSALTGIKEGFQYLRHETTILVVLVFVLLSIVFSTPYQRLMPVFCDDILKVGGTAVGATGMGVLLSVSAVGAVIVSLILASLPNKKRGLILLASSLLMSLALVGFSFSTSWPLSLALIFFLGLGQTGQMTLASTLMQYYVDPEYLGRVMSILMMQYGLISFGTFFAGVLAETTGVQWAVGGFGMVIILLSIVALASVPRIRNLE